MSSLDFRLTHFAVLAVATALPAACTLDRLGTSASPSDGGPGFGGATSDGSLDGGGAGGAIPIPDGGCFPGLKPCEGFCVGEDLPEYGCNPAACDPCFLPNGTATCESQRCEIASCNAPFLDCNSNPADGCETNVNADPTNCGSCGFDCIAMFGLNNICVDGSCEVSDCPVLGTQDCDGDPATGSNGCEIDVASDPSNCSFCGNVCQIAHATAGCGNGQCFILSCNGAWRPCDSDPLNGCETNTTNNVNNCGGCNQPCPGGNGTPFCNNGNCGILCNPGRGDCNGSASDGCETNTSTNLQHCGGCSQGCTLANAVEICSGGNCTISSCNSPFDNCDGNVGNGCETNTDTSLQHCGDCNQPCSYPSASASCQNGSCSLGACNSGRGNCDGNASNGCETNTNTSNQHCSGCNQPCNPANGTGQCVNGNCTVTGCNAPFDDCDGNASNGCERNTNTSTSHCGGCNQPCSSVGGTPSCSGGTCMISCTGDNGDCNMDVSDGCETNLSTNELHCGQCNDPCPGMQQCMGSICS